MLRKINHHMDPQISSRISPELTDPQWRNIDPLFQEFRQDGRSGRPSHNPRLVFARVPWVLGTGSVWSRVPERYPDFRTCNRRFKLWLDTGLVHLAMERLYGEEGLGLCSSMAARKPSFPGASTLRWPFGRPFARR
jgi:transposase